MTRYSSLASVSATRLRLRELGLSTKKALGQHFLVDDGIVGKIIRFASLTPESRVVEVGPGIGTLTEALLTQDIASLASIEVDAALWSGLCEHFPSLQLVCGDALASQTLELLQNMAPTALVANLPYAVAATIILEYFQKVPSLMSATVMVQREVAERIAARPKTRDYGAYTVKLRLLVSVVGSFNVSAQCFYPPPRVDSAVIRLERHNIRLPEELLATASQLADAAFFQRRKTIRNSMRAYFAARSPGAFCADPVPTANGVDLSTQNESRSSLEKGSDASSVDVLLSAGGVDPLVRGETLDPETFLRMARAWLAEV